MQARRRRAARMAGRQDPERIAGPDGGTRPDARHHRLVRRPQAPVVPDHDHSPPAHRAGEAHHARPGRPYDGARGCREVHAAVPAAVGRGWWDERPRDPGRAVERPPERSGRDVPPGPAGSGPRGYGAPEQEQRAQQGGQWPRSGTGERHGPTVPRE